MVNRAWVKRVLATFLWLLLPISALADGMVFPPVAFPAHVTIPDQRALIHFTNGTERLVIETRFTGSGTNFAWVVPLPSQPVIEEATTGLFPTLQYLFRPRIQHDVPRYYLRILLFILIVFLFRLTVKTIWDAFLFLFVFFILLLVLLPAFYNTRKRAISSTSPVHEVTVLDRKLVGVFETTTITSRDPKALQTWLRENSFVVSANSEQVIESYVKDGWVFVTTKVRRDKPDRETSTPHPLSFTFKTTKPVYPMRLTGVDNGQLQIELYVFGPKRATAPHFKVERCTRPFYPGMLLDGSYNWRERSPVGLNIVHPLLRKWVDGSPVATKLTATLSPDDMRQDVWLDWTWFSEKKNHLFSREGAVTTAANWGSGFFAVGLFVVFLVARGNNRQRLPKLAGVTAMFSITFVGLIYLALPKTEVRLINSPWVTQKETHIALYYYLFDTTNSPTHAEIKAKVQRLLANPTNDAEWVMYGGKGNELNNFRYGGRMREEDSPGNFMVREDGDKMKFIIYDDEGGEDVFPDLRQR